MRHIDNEGLLNTRVRYVILFLGSACIASIASNMIVLNFTLICMGTDRNESTPANVPRGKYDYTQTEKSQLNWAVAIGTLIAAWPFHWFYEKYGARVVFFVAGLISTLSTVAIPWVAAYSYNLFLVARFFQGVSFGADFAAIGLIVVHWASLKQHGLFISLLSSFSQISVMFTMPVAGELCESSWGWPSVYYVHAVLSAVLFTAWLVYYRNDPERHPLMTDVELEKIRRDKGDVKQQEREETPIKAIMTNPVMWAVWLSAFGELMMSQFIVLYGPTYLKEVLGFRVAHTGYFVAIPRALHLAFKIISGIASDRIKFLSEKTKMRIFNTIALKVSGIFFCILGFLSAKYANYSLVVLLIIEVSTGFICGGFYKCATLVARQHSHFVLSQIQFIKCLSLFIEPLLVFLICQNNTLAEWRIVFLIHGVLLIAGNVIFWFFATAEPAEFTKIHELKDTPEAKRFSEAETKFRPSFDRLPDTTFYDYPIYSLGDGKIEDMEYVADHAGITLGRISAMQTLRSSEDVAENGAREITETPTDNIRMSSAEVLRSSMTPLGMNNTLNIQRNENTSGSLAVGMSSFMQNSNSGVPLDRPLFINTSMTAAQRIDIYRRLSSPPQDEEPALLFRWS